MDRLRRAPNPFNTFTEQLSNNLSNDYVEQNEMSKRNAEIQKGFEMLGENPSRLDILQTIEGLRIPDEQKKRLYTGFGDIEQDKLRREKAIEEKAKTNEKEQQEREKSEKNAVRAKKIAQAYGISEEEAEGLEPADLAALGRNRNKAAPGGLTGQAVPAEVGSKIKLVLDSHKGADADELAAAMDEAGIPPTYSNKYVENRRRQDENKIKSEENSLKKVDESFKAQKDFIDSTTQGYRGFKTDMEPRLKQMQQINSDDLISPSAAKFLEIMDIPLGVLENPSNELYSKLSQDLLKGLPETYGNRILKVEVDNFLKTIPTLLNSADGRRMIASNLLKLGEMKETFYNEMRNMQKQYLDTEKPLPKDFEQRVLDNTLPMINRLNQDFSQMSQIKSVPENTVPFFDPQGGISFVPNNPEALQWAATNGGRRIW